ncbi:MAG: hypothetical protein Ct9H300mP16_01040 [Pseudomonadota bacterium]|nr:MAG: hypothetical protein Ct9H300mP16_01040 [Pseudomonadota bacterium]
MSLPEQHRCGGSARQCVVTAVWPWSLAGFRRPAVGAGWAGNSVAGNGYAAWRVSPEEPQVRSGRVVYTLPGGVRKAHHCRCALSVAFAAIDGLSIVAFVGGLILGMITATLAAATQPIVPVPERDNDRTASASSMASNNPTATEYIKHHLQNLTFGQHPDGSWGLAHGAQEAREMGFWAIPLDTMFWSVFLGALFLGCFEGPPPRNGGHPQRFSEFRRVVIDFIDDNVRGSFSGKNA